MSAGPSSDARNDGWFRAGLSLPRDILIAPERAFAAAGAGASWLPSYAVVAAAGLTSGLLAWPAVARVAAIAPDAAKLGTTPGNLAEASRTVLTNIVFSELLMPLIFIGLTATTLTMIARFKGVQTRYAGFAALAAACLVPSIVGELLAGVMIRLHDPASYHTWRPLVLALPDNLGVFAAPGNDRELGFLARFSVFDVWSYALLAFGFAKLVPVRFVTAVLVAFALDFFLSLIG